MIKLFAMVVDKNPNFSHIFRPLLVFWCPSRDWKRSETIVLLLLLVHTATFQFYAAFGFTKSKDEIFEPVNDDQNYSEFLLLLRISIRGAKRRIEKGSKVDLETQKPKSYEGGERSKVVGEIDLGSCPFIILECFCTRLYRVKSKISAKPLYCWAGVNECREMAGKEITQR